MQFADAIGGSIIRQIKSGTRSKAGAAEIAFDSGRNSGRAERAASIAEKSNRISRVHQAEIDLRGFTAEADSSGYWAAAYELQPDRNGDWEIKLERSEFAEYSDSNGAGARNTGRFCGGAGENHAGRRLFAGGIADHGAFFEGCSAGGCVSKRAGHSRAHGTGSVWRGPDGADWRTSAGGQSN